MVRRILTWLVTGFIALAPVAVTLWLVIWLIGALESVAGPAIAWLIGPDRYVPGAGIAFALLVLIGAGALLQGYVGRRLFELLEAVIDRLPLVKTLYAAARDLARFVQPGRELGGRVVAWRPLPQATLIGFVTGESLARLSGGGEPGDGDDRVAVYFPMSYQIGGYTVVLPRAELEVLDVSVEEGMRRVVTAGVSREAQASTPPGR